MKPVSSVVVLSLTALFTSGFTVADASNPQVPYNRPLDLPLYEEFAYVEDYRVNQSILGAIRWASLAPLVGAAAGALMIKKEDHDGSLQGALIGGVIGIPVGATLGYWKGKSWEERRAGGDFTAPRLRVGYELEAGGGGSSSHMGGIALS
jgi:hypothetical protein